MVQRNVDAADDSGKTVWPVVGLIEWVCTPSGKRFCTRLEAVGDPPVVPPANRVGSRQFRSYPF